MGIQTNFKSLRDSCWKRFKHVLVVYYQFLKHIFKFQIQCILRKSSNSLLSFKKWHIKFFSSCIYLNTWNFKEAFSRSLYLHTILHEIFRRKFLSNNHFVKMINIWCQTLKKNNSHLLTLKAVFYVLRTGHNNPKYSF